MNRKEIVNHLFKLLTYLSPYPGDLKKPGNKHGFSGGSIQQIYVLFVFVQNVHEISVPERIIVCNQSIGLKR